MRDGWVIKKLEDVCTKFGAGPFGSNMKVSTFVDAGIPVVSGNHMSELELVEESFNYVTEDHANRMQSSIVQRNDVVITKAGTIGQVSLIPENSKFLRYVLSSRQLFARPNVEYVVPKYLAIYLKYGRGQDQILSNVNRTGVPSLSQAVSFMKNVRIELPPLPEQKRIVDLISSADSYIAALKQQLESTKKSRKAVLRELLTVGGIGWEESTLGDLISHSIGGIWGEEQGGAEVDVPVYRQTEFSDSGILTTPAEAIRSVSKSQLKNRTLQEGDILIQKSAGTPNLPGRVVSVPNLNGEVATFSNFLNLLRPNTDMCISRLAFLIFWDKHQDGRAFQYQRGTNIKNLDLPSYLLETILIPSAPDQNRIVELISTFDDFLAQTNHSISLFENLRSGLLSDLLSGDHEIPSSYDKVIGAA